MPAMAAALSKTLQLMALRPKISTTECMTVMSFVPTNGANFRCPDANGETMSLGKPTNVQADARITNRVGVNVFVAKRSPGAMICLCRMSIAVVPNSRL